TPAQWKAEFARRAAENKQPDVRALTGREMKSITGRGIYRIQYFAGTYPWHRSIRDANLCNGNLFKSFTDIQVAPARGAGLALQRTYNSQDERIGPLGIGWTRADDMRIEAAGPDHVPGPDFIGRKHTYQQDAVGPQSPSP